MNVDGDQLLVFMSDDHIEREINLFRDEADGSQKD